MAYFMNLNEMYRDKVPQVTFKVREMITPGEYGWKDRTTDHFFKNKTVVLFSLPGAFTPTCSSTHLPGYEEKYNELKKYVDEVYIFNEETPYDLISKLKPDIIVKGGDYMPSKVVGSDICEVRIFNFINGYSTTDILDKMK